MAVALPILCSDDLKDRVDHFLRLLKNQGNTFDLYVYQQIESDVPNHGVLLNTALRTLKDLQWFFDIVVLAAPLAAPKDQHLGRGTAPRFLPRYPRAKPLLVVPSSAKGSGPREDVDGTAAIVLTKKQFARLDRFPSTPNGVVSTAAMAEVLNRSGVTPWRSVESFALKHSPQEMGCLPPSAHSTAGADEHAQAKILSVKTLLDAAVYTVRQD
mmetsp:Transcript_28846/g.68913  ORF Transcript_28846/g.68913 Transcript_28846/m.68913 type:complete len:213 (+) Transcript_28846:549-1187(+)